MIKYAGGVCKTAKIHSLLRKIFYLIVFLLPPFFVVSQTEPPPDSAGTPAVNEESAAAGSAGNTLDPGVTIEELANTPASEAPVTASETAPSGAEAQTSGQTGAAKPKPAPIEAPRWTGSLSEDLLRPTRSYAPLYPRDAVIGELGKGEASEAAYSYAVAVLSNIMADKQNAPSLRMLGETDKTEIFEKIKKVEPRKVRSGGGLIEPDGSNSFLFRFIGREKEVSGSLYILPDEEPETIRWTLDSVLMEDVIVSASKNDTRDYDYLPYARMY
ncbi:MAG: hypothetical protein LBG72_03540 [Spirochaetaceae bacterium]|jgi:hypothetical protein|nr:hypothetical protein [Spirochaetaceae bacterium]